ncbi:hypothetical protein [Chitinimonas sp.]|uniref:hypothetical protein n=1 Tax=Chitinimonas sp. TaxID=1934313 RepID=UPI002F9565DB
MPTEISINPASGHILFGGLEITPLTTIASLGSSFAISEERLVSVYGQNVPCRFAHATLQAEGTTFELGLRFERNILVSASLALSTPALRAQTEADFYQALEPTRRLHERWLKQQLGDISSSYAKFPWGVAGVAQDKSDNIYIYLHNRNNSWALGHR